MWLLSATTLKLHAFTDAIPDYVILSHTWGQDEVSFDDISKCHAKTMAGYDKIVGCCRQAIHDGFEWAWIDTCCIDKRSSAELSEAINSMYKWYWQASICYAYLSDVSGNLAWEEQLKCSRWFSRGWTLQELLAPDAVEFYDNSWKLLGTRARLVDHIQEITKIDRRFLLNRDTIRDASIATKFSWAAPRITTRVEDRAYCMLGLVQVNMPMLYGEGDRAFYRLQLEIIRQTNEHSIFAWQPHSADWQTTAVLAPSPGCFISAADITPIAARKSIETMTHEVTNNGLRITLPSIRIDQSRIIALLDCRDCTGSIIGLWLEHVTNGKYQRLFNSKLVTLSAEEEADAELMTMFLVADRVPKQATSSAPCLLRLGSLETNCICYVSRILLADQRTMALEPYDPVPKTHGGMEDPTAYALNDLILREGMAACITIVGKNENPSRTISTIDIVFALRRGRVVVRIAGHYMYFARHWPDEMRLILTGELDDIGDFAQQWHPEVGTTIVETKKSRSEGNRLYKLSVRVIHCVCGKIKQGSEACACMRDELALRNVRSYPRSSSLGYFS
ncbi:heterokaryon incompatibility protein-domain-containing protein [Paraphoma chrysanthemicola]|nr:heterokaryon incompatibility protein-domain-containing protein [Paraphoma chrysanthemicola]